MTNASNTTRDTFPRTAIHWQVARPADIAYGPRRWYWCTEVGFRDRHREVSTFLTYMLRSEHKNSNQKSVFTSGNLAHFCSSTRMPISWFVHPWFKTRYVNSHKSHDRLTERGTINDRQQGLHNNVLCRRQDHKPRKAKTQLTGSQDVILNFHPQEKLDRNPVLGRKTNLTSTSTQISQIK
jgi:hypothetical protein